MGILAPLPVNCSQVVEAFSHKTVVRSQGLLNIRQHFPYRRRPLEKRLGLGMLILGMVESHQLSHQMPRGVGFNRIVIDFLSSHFDGSQLVIDILA